MHLKGGFNNMTTVRDTRVWVSSVLTATDSVLSWTVSVSVVYSATKSRVKCDWNASTRRLTLSAGGKSASLTIHRSQYSTDQHSVRIRDFGFKICKNSSGNRPIGASYWYVQVLQLTDAYM